jgi:hypothetical protein
MCSIVSFSSLHILHLLSSFAYLNLAIIFLSFELSLLRYTGTSSVMHLSDCLLPGFSPFSLACPCLCPSRSSPRSSIFLPLSFFPLPHFHIRSSCSNSFSLSHPRSILLYPILSSNFAVLFPAFTLNLLLLHFSITMYPGVSLSAPSTHLKYFSCTLSTSSCSFHSQISLPCS